MTTIVQKDVRARADLRRHFSQFRSCKYSGDVTLEYWDRVGLLLFLLPGLRYPLDLHLFNLLVHSPALVIAEKILESSVLLNLLCPPRSDAGRELARIRADDLVAWDGTLCIKVGYEGLDLLLRELMAGDCFDGVGVFLHDLSVGCLVGQLKLLLR